MNHLNENLIGIATEEKKIEPVRKEVINHASKQLFAYISMKSRQGRNKPRSQSHKTKIQLFWMIFKLKIQLKQNGG